MPPDLPMPPFRPAPARRGLALGAVLVLLSACASAGGPAAVPAPELPRRDGVTYTFYDVSGRNAEEIYAALRAGGPRLEGRTVFGRTNWNVQWRARWMPGGPGGECRATEVDVDLTMAVVMPRWTGRPEARARLAQQWDTFIAELAEHEHGHVDNAVRAVREMREAIQAVRAPCGEMQARAEAESARVLREARQRDRAFDEAAYASAANAWPPRETP